jgi:hypothetical protein
MNEEQFNEHLEKLKAQLTVPKISRMIVKGIAKHSVAFIAATLAKTYCPTENKKQQLQVTVGAYVIGGMAGEAAAEWAAKEFDEALEFVMGIIKNVKEAQEKPAEEPKLTLAE